jgi:hypothetical protein
VAVRGDTVEPWEAWRSYRAVADALVAVDALTAPVADALASELDDVLAVRGVTLAGAFSGAPWPDVEVLRRPPASPPPPGAGPTWLEAEIERHLDLFASFNPGARSWAARDLVRIIGSHVRAFEAVGLLPAAEATRIRDEVVSSLHAAGVDPDRPAEPDVAPRAEWVQFLGGAPGPIPEPFVPTETRRPSLTIGQVRGVAVRLTDVAWNSAAVRLDLLLRPVTPVSGSATPLHARLVDDGGRLHLGQPDTRRRDVAALHLFLRPGLADGVRGFDLRLTKGGERIEASVAL